MFKSSYLILFTVLIANQLFAQFSDEYVHYKKIYPDEDKIRLYDETNVFIRIKNNDIEIHANYHEEDLYLNVSASFYSEESITYSTFFEIYDLKASSFIYQKNKYNEHKVKDFKHKDDLDGSAFYDDSKSVNFIYSNLKEGAKTILFYKEKINNPRFLGTFYFGNFYPIIHSVYTITADKKITLTFKEFNTDSLDIKFTKEEKGNNIIYKWETKNAGKIESEDDATNFRNIIAHLIPYISSFEVDNKEIDLLSDVGGLYKWYYDLVKNVNEENPDEELVKIVHSLIADEDTELEKVKAIYYWAQQNIKYVAFEYALGGFVPRDANEIYAKKYGDCKDNSSIMKEMLEIAEIKGHLTWIGTREIPYTYKEVPTPAADNHMILTYFNDTNIYFLDATGRFYPLGLPSSHIQGKEALIAIDSTQYLIKKVPVVSASNNYLYDTVRLSIIGNNLKGKGSIRLNGYQKIDYYNILERIKTFEKLKTFYTLILRKGNNKFLIEKFNELNKYDYEKDFIIDYSFKIDNYVLVADDEKYVNLNLSKYITAYKIKKEDELDKEFKYQNYSVYVNELTIPEGYHIDYIPPDMTLEYDKYSAHITYTQKGNKIEYSYDITLNFIEIKKEEHKEFNAFIAQIEKAFKETIVLKKD